MDRLPGNVRILIESSTWIFAKTYASTWPHEYVVRDQVDEDVFVECVRYIRANGYQGKFYTSDITYLDYANRVYWTMALLSKELRLSIGVVKSTPMNIV